MTQAADRSFSDLQSAARTLNLTILCALDKQTCDQRDDLPPGTACLLLLSPDEPAFWPAFTQSPEFRDGAPDPMDRWSRRIAGSLARDIGAHPLFPFGGPPHHNFVDWARASERAFASPLGMLVHPQTGLWLSFRAALALPHPVKELPAPVSSPCDSCTTRPCLSACPVSAFGPDGYDTRACRTFLQQPGGNDCMSHGCLARRACPRGRNHGRFSAHSAYHMHHFL
ncbi:ferredoxin [Pseudooceanicola sp. C21-150M6]|uniref:ferredoxin n=1 Tax=Pseudooceanicola sp. C21-150M6 TaxID=3434355 RepID=UPI003D7F8EFA